MISKEEYIKAKETIDAFEEQLNEKFVESYTCINCKENEVKPYSVDVLGQDEGCWLDGTVIRADVGYGSRHDLSSYYFAICDDCLDSLEDSGLLVDIKQLRKKIKKERS